LNFTIYNILFELLENILISFIIVMQSLGELDPFFVATFFEELGIHWEIFDGKGKQHNVEFNGSPTEPLLISGWGRLRLY
jgi:hypothetical protein